LKAQQYTPFFSQDSTDQWLDFYSYTNSGNCFFEKSTSYYLDGDTVFSGQTYVQLHSITFWVWRYFMNPTCPTDTDHYLEFHGGLREANKQVFYTTGTGPERLIYDFNLEVGDTVPDPSGYTSPSSYDWLVIQSIDSTLAFGSYRKRFIIYNGQMIVEGIGSSRGLLYPIDLYVWDEYLSLCYAEQGVPLYASSGQTCDFDLTSSINDDNTLDNRVIVYPNPVASNSAFQMRFEQAEQRTITLQRMDGSAVQTYQTNDQTFTSDQNLAAGIYLIDVLHPKGKRSYHYLVVQ